MARVTGPWGVEYPVNFVSDGDTTREAFGKHIQEIERIYGLLSGLGAAKIEAEDLNTALGGYVTTTAFNNHVNSTNPHPNLQLATLGGNLDVSRISGNWPTSRLSGNLDASRISGNFGADRINGLDEAIRRNSSGITDASIGAKGYVKFGNGLMMQWGRGDREFNDTSDADTVTTQNFPTSFGTACFCIVTGSWLPNASGTTNDAGFKLISYSNSGFTYKWEGYGNVAGATIAGSRVTYIAIGN